MKKLLFAMAAFLVCGAAIAQKDALSSNTKGFLYVAAGPAIPVGDFGDNNFEANEDAGFAKTGYTINLHGGYNFVANFGIKATGFYSSHGVENSTGIVGNVNLGHWQYYGLTVGPMYYVPLTSAIDLSLAAEVGIANAGSPKVSYQGQDLMKDDWSVTMPVKGGAAMHFLLGGRTKLLLGADYLYMKPKFVITYLNEDGTWSNENVKQKMGVVNVFAGVGISF